MKNKPDCLRKPVMVHAKMYSTIQKSALSQQNNRTCFSSRTGTAAPLIFTSEGRGCNGKRQGRAWVKRMAGAVGELGVDGRTGSLLGEKGTTTSTRTVRQSDRDAERGDGEDVGRE